MRGRTRGGQRVTSKVQRVREGSPSAIENARARATREGSAALWCSAAARGRRPRTRTRHATRALRKQRAGMEEEEGPLWMTLARLVKNEFCLHKALNKVYM